MSFNNSPPVIPSNPEQFLGGEANPSSSEEVRLFERKFQAAVQAEQERASRDAILALIHDAWLAAQEIADDGERNGALDACDRLQERVVGPKPKEFSGRRRTKFSFAICASVRYFSD